MKRKSKIKNVILPRGQRTYPAHPRRFKGETETLPLWQQVYNLVDGKVNRISYDAYYEQGAGYTLPEEVHEMVRMLGEIDEETPRDKLHEFAGYAVSPAVNQIIFGSTL